MKDNSYLKQLIENMDENTSLDSLQAYVEEMVNVRGFSDETPQDCLLLLTEELGELAKEVRKMRRLRRKHEALQTGKVWQQGAERWK